MAEKVVNRYPLDNQKPDSNHLIQDLAASEDHFHESCLQKAVKNGVRDLGFSKEGDLSYL